LWHRPCPILKETGNRGRVCVDLLRDFERRQRGFVERRQIGFVGCLGDPENRLNRAGRPVGAQRFVRLV